MTTADAIYFAGMWKAAVLMFLAVWAFVFALFPQLWLNRPWRFLAAYLCTLMFGTPPQLDPEGRSVRLNPWRAAVFAWKLSA